MENELFEAGEPNEIEDYRNEIEQIRRNWQEFISDNGDKLVPGSTLDHKVRTEVPAMMSQIDHLMVERNNDPTIHNFGQYMEDLKGEINKAKQEVQNQLNK